MPMKTLRDALNEALHQEFERDPTVFVIGEDVAGGRGGTGTLDCTGGVFGVTRGLMTKFGEDRVLDTPISEPAIIGAAIDALAEEGITCDLVDPRTTSPLDEETILESVEATGRLIVVDESPPRCGLTADISAMVAQKAFSSLKAPIQQVTAPHTPVPFAPELERAYLPDAERVKAAIRTTLA